MDVYCHPFTSGGQEIPIQEAKLTELVTLVTNYSCGEEYCTEESGGFPLSWAEYREPGSEFIKASTDPKSIAYQLEKVYKMDAKKKKAIGEKARKWTLENFDIKKIAAEFEKIIDAAPFVDEIKDVTEEPRDLNYQPLENVSDEEWVDDILKNMLKRPFTHEHREGKKIIEPLKQGKSRQMIFENIKKMAHTENANQREKLPFSSLLDENKGGRVAVVMPRSVGDVFLCTSLLPSIKKRYPKKDVYFITDPHNFELFDGNPYIHKVIPYSREIDSTFILEGQGGYNGFFDVAYRLGTMTQTDNLYSHNGQDKIDFEIYEH